MYSDFKCDRYMLTNKKVCGKYQHQDGSRALINGKKPRPKKIFQKHKSKFVEDLENDNDNLEDDTDNKKEDIEEYMDKYSLEYDVNAGVVDANGASDDIAIQDNNNNLKNNDDEDDINYDFNTEIPTTKFGISNSEFPTESPIEIATTKFSDNIPNSDEQDDLLNNNDLTTELFSGDYQTEGSLSNSEFQTNGPTITTIFQQKHERQPKRNVVSILCKIGFF